MIHKLLIPIPPSFNHQTAFVTLKPFPRRQDIRAKQQVYIKVLREKVKKNEMERKSLLEREQLYKDLELNAGVGTTLLIIGKFFISTSFFQMRSRISATRLAMTVGLSSY